MDPQEPQDSEESQEPRDSQEVITPVAPCCQRFNPTPWEGREYVLDWEHFLKVPVLCFLHIPLRIGSMMKKTLERIHNYDVEKAPYLVLTEDVSPWKSEYYFQVEKEIFGYENVTLSGTFLTKVFEGPYKNVPLWMKEMEEWVAKQGKRAKKTYAWYTTCPKCAKSFGKNYVVLFAQVS